MDILLPILFVLVIVGAVIWKNKPEWISKVKSWFVE
jgi:hypothetical protein|tara:strand:+ start:257 stop:364 length:108 start_codon:yes stop_codon:yes gene_type:complete